MNRMVEVISLELGDSMTRKKVLELYRVLLNDEQWEDLNLTVEGHLKELFYHYLEEGIEEIKDEILNGEMN